jgi:tripartite-type tricarboxylate transporter receptor subunit TctC
MVLSMQKQGVARTETTAWPRRKVLLGALGAVSGNALAAAAAAAAESPSATPATPATPVLPPRLRLLCGASAGGTPDLIARRLASALEPTFPGGVLVDNRPGAGAVLGVAALRQAAPDGATWLLGHAGLVTLNAELPGLRLSYDPQRDLLPLAQITQTAFVLAVGPAVPAEVSTLAMLQQWWREQPGKASHASPGLGTMPHLLGVLLGRESGLALTHLVYPGGQQAIADVLGGHVSAVILPEGLLRPWQGGGLRLLASSGAQRSRFLPTVPTFVELGLAGLSGQEWFACFAPPGTPTALLTQASSRLRAACDSPAWVEGLAALALQPAYLEPAALAERILRERTQWRRVMAQNAIRVE